MMPILLITCAAMLAGKHHRHHHHHHVAAAAATAATATAAANATEEPAQTAEAEAVVAKMKAIEQKIDVPAAAEAAVGTHQGRLIVNGPLPADFAAVFATAVAEATGCDKNSVKVVSTHGVTEAAPSFVQLVPLSVLFAPSFLQLGDGEVEIVFEAPADIVTQVEAQAADENSPLVNGALNKFLVAADAPEALAQTPAAATPSGGHLEVDTEMPYGELEPFGREDTAQELTDQSIHESDAMVDQLERAEVAEEKRAVFRAITRLRGAAITSFDGIARSQTGNIDEYNHNHQWRTAHPLHHLADEESDVAKWAFPNNAD